MAKRAGLVFYKILQRFIRDSNHVRLRPIFTLIIKKYGLTIPTLSNKVVHYLLKENNIDGALGLITELNQNNIAVNFPSDLIQMLTEQGRSLDAYKLLINAKNNLPTMDVVDYSVIIDILCKGGWIDKALEICNFAKEKGVVLNVVTYNSVLNGLCRQGCLIEAFRLFDSLERHKIVPSDMTYGTLIDSLVREGFLADARKLFERMCVKGIKPNTHIYNSLINGYCKIGNVEEALKLVRDLENISLKPDKFTLSFVIYGFSLEGDMEGALDFFINMKTNGFSPDYLGFLYLVRGLCAKGRMEESRSIMREMLQDESVTEIINKVNAEIEDESIQSVLVDLCEQGSIQGALTILNEIGAMFFPYKTRSDASISSLDNLHLMDEIDFNVFYSQVASLCEQGDLPGANALAKNMMASFVKNS